MENMVDSALILAAGFGSRFVPLTYECPKGLLEVFSERMIERQIKQLHKVGIKEITIVVGYLKEKFEYLIDLYGVKLLYNPEFAEKNTLATLYHAREAVKGKNFYILSSDNWMRENLYHSIEPYSWYAASFMEGETKEWALTVSETGRILPIVCTVRSSLKRNSFPHFSPSLRNTITGRERRIIIGRMSSCGNWETFLRFMQTVKKNR